LCACSNGSPNPAAAPSAAERLQVCTSISSLAGSIMTLRQNGALMSELMAKVDNEDPMLGPMTNELIALAYEKPRMSVEKNRERYVVDFQNKAFSGCMKEFR